MDIKAAEEVAGLSLLPKSIIDLWDKLLKRYYWSIIKWRVGEAEWESNVMFSPRCFSGCPRSHQPAVCQLRLPRDPSPIAPIPTCVPLSGQALVPVHPRFPVIRNRALCRGNSCPQ